MAPNGVLTRESLDSIVATGSINGYTLSSSGKSICNLSSKLTGLKLPVSRGEELLVATEIQVASLLAYALTHGINFRAGRTGTSSRNGGTSRRSR